MSDSIIETENAAKYFGSRAAVKDLSICIRRGEIAGIVGPDGAGKSTLIRLMLGLFADFEGRVKLFGRDPATVRERIGYVPQRFSLYGNLTVMENIRLMGSLYGVGRSDIDKKAEEILTFTGLWNFRSREAAHLSGGMKQKLALAAGLMQEPEIFFLDEPTTGVDSSARREFWSLLYEMNGRGMTIVTATPYMDEAELCHRTALLSEGHLVRFAPPKQMEEEYPFHILKIPMQENDGELFRKCRMRSLYTFGNRYHAVTEHLEETKADIAATLSGRGISSDSVKEIRPSLEDVFVLYAEKETDHGNGG